MAKQQSTTPKRARSKRDDQKQADRGTSQNGNGNEAATYEQELAHYLQERIKPRLNRGSIPLLARSIAKEIAHRRPDENADTAGEPSTEEDDAVRDEADDDLRGEADDASDEVDVDDFDEEEDDVRGEADDDFDEEEDDVRGEADDDFDEEEDDVRGEADDDFDEEEDDVRGEADDDFSDEEDDNDGSFEDELRDLQANLGDDWILRFSVQGEDTWLTAEKDDGSQHVEAPAADVLADVVELLNEGGGRSS